MSYDEGGKEMKILNLYAGIGGNRKKWILQDSDVVVAVEIDPYIAAIYQKAFPNDIVIVGDAHEYLLEHFREFDFIWSSPPCPTHSKVRKQLAFKRRSDGTVFEQNKPVYPNMLLYQEIILLQHYYKGLYCVENVVPYYEPLIEAQRIGRHLFWTNFEIPKIKVEPRGSFDNIEELALKLGYDLKDFYKVDKRIVLRNCVEPEIGEYIFSLVKTYQENEDFEKYIGDYKEDKSNGNN